MEETRARDGWIPQLFQLLQEIQENANRKQKDYKINEFLKFLSLQNESEV